MDYSTDFWSENHYDALGAEKVTDYLCTYIIDNFELPDHSADPRYEIWNEEYYEWLDVKEEYKQNDRDN